MIDKQKLVEEVVAELERQATEREHQSANATELALSYPGGGKSHSDTQMFQHQERAELIAIAARDLRASIADVQGMDISKKSPVIAIGSIAQVRDQEGSESVVFIIRGKHGCSVTCGGQEIFALNIVAPLGGALLGHKAGEHVKVQIGPRINSLDIISVE